MFGKIATVINAFRGLRTLRRHERWTRSDLLGRQTTELASLRDFAYRHSPFYREFHKGYEQAPLAELPIMMEHFAEFVTDHSLRLSDLRAHLAGGSTGRYRDAYEVVTTSGSTGNPGIFLFDSRDRPGVDALRGLMVASDDTPNAEEVRASVVSALSAKGVVVPNVRVERVDAIPKARSGKTPLIKAYQKGSPS